MSFPFAWPAFGCPWVSAVSSVASWPMVFSISMVLPEKLGGGKSLLYTTQGLVFADHMNSQVAFLDRVSGAIILQLLLNSTNRGLITFSIGVASSFNMAPSSTQTKTWFRPKGWFTEREEVIIVNKVLRDDPTKVMNSVFVKQYG